ncbi:hypothetical protein FQN57_001057 [Myotisia sp. PD_48]|nr:hypothetical protein FQN57_001057 [Myotisia sp. PD_48]
MASTIEFQTPQSMQAARYYGKRDIRIDTIEPLPCGPDEVRLKVAYCGVCGSDLHEYIVGPMFLPQHGKKHPFNGSELPVTLGHEMSGVVVEVGEKVDAEKMNIKLGQKMFVNPCITDRQLDFKDACTSCKGGVKNLCSRLGFYGLAGPNGGLAEYIVVKAINLFPLPDSVSLKSGALVEPLAVAWHCVRISGFQAGQNAVVFGAGPIGLALLLVLKVWGAKSVIVSEILETRIEWAKRLGADFVINPLQGAGDGAGDPVVAKANEISGGALGGGADVSFEATGIQAAVVSSIACVRPGGTIMNVSIHEKPVTINMNALALTEKRLMGSLCYNDEDIQAVINALADGSLVADGLVTSIVPLEETVNGVFEELVNRRENHVKILIQPNPSSLS